WPDLIIANDTQPNKLYINTRSGSFKESGVISGIAFSEDGIARAGMGVDAADYDRSGRPSIVIGNFSNQMMALYHNEGNTLFVDEAPRSDVGRKSLLTLGFGCFFFDYDNDGWPDIFVANGHIENEIERIQKRVKYAEPAHLFRNLGKDTFTEVSAGDLALPRVGRGAAYADIDNDGDLDVLMTTNGGPAVLLRNEGGVNKSLRIKLSGTRSNRDGIGALVTVRAGNDVQSQTMRSGSSYLSASELVLTFGLSQHAQADDIKIYWPSGQTDDLKNVPAGETVTVKEGAGISQRRPYESRRPATSIAAAKVK
ncbi:MAG TPA: CRTAC1 family protein, partial [Terriglobales bacterium]|nr:CRTAC1 family protein [Terriglobales bacterium]